MVWSGPSRALATFACWVLVLTGLVPGRAWGHPVGSRLATAGPPATAERAAGGPPRAAAKVLDCGPLVGAVKGEPAGSPLGASAALGPVRASIAVTVPPGLAGLAGSVEHPVLTVVVGGRRVGRWPVALPAQAGPVGPAQPPGVVLATMGPSTSTVPLCVARFGVSHPVTAVLVATYSGGAHCCTWVAAYPVWPLSARLRAPVEQYLGDPGARLQAGDGQAVLVTADDAFAYRFDAYAASGMPVRTLELAGDRFVATTRAHPALVAADAATFWSAYLQVQSPEQGEGRGGGLGLLAAWVADECLLGRGTQAWAEVRHLEGRGLLTGGPAGQAGPWPVGARYVAALRSFLRARHYC